MKKLLLYVVGIQFAFAACMVGYVFLGALNKPKYLVNEYERHFGPVTVNASDIPIGELKIVQWGGYPVAVLRRSPEQMQSIDRSIGVLDPESDKSQPASWFEERNRLISNTKIQSKHRSIDPEYFVTFWFSTNSGCSLFYHKEKQPFYDQFDIAMLNSSNGMFFDMCTGSIFDMAGRTLYNNRKKFPYNLMIPKYSIENGRITIGITE